MSQPFRMGMMLPVEHAADDSPTDRFKNLLEAARLAEQAGFKFLDAPQHYLASPSQYFHCVPLLARVAAEVETVDLCTNIIQLTLHNPVMVAEELATLDVITGGRLVAGFGRGYREDEFKAFGKIRDPVSGPFSKVWKDGTYAWDGVAEAKKFWTSVEGQEQENWHSKWIV